MYKLIFYALLYVVSLESCHSCNLELLQHQLNELNQTSSNLSLCPTLVLVLVVTLSSQIQDQAPWRCSLPLSLSMLFYCSSFDSFSLTLCTFKHRKGICTYLSSYLPRLHNKLDCVRLSRNLYIDYVHLSRNLHVHYVRLGRNLYVHYVRLIQHHRAMIIDSTFPNTILKFKHQF